MARHLSRRDLIVRGGALGVTGLSLPALLAACGGSETASTTTGPGTSVTTASDGSITVFNWPLYIDKDGYLRSQSDYLEPVGPGYWERS